MSLVVGVDGGGTRTRVVIVDEGGDELARVEGPAALPDPDAPGRAAGVVEETVRLAADRAAVALPCAALWAGLAGAGSAATRSAVEVELRRHGLAERVGVGTDVEAAAEDAFAGGAGILLVAGTGSIAWGRTTAGAECRVGGWGAGVGDEGSGWAIGLAALRSTLHTLDGRAPRTRLAPAILDELGATDPRDVVEWAGRGTKAEVAALAPIVVAEAEGGDPAALGILAEAVEALAEHVRALRATEGAWPTPAPLALAGGLLHPGGPLRERVLAALPEAEFRVLARALRPEMGAAALARRIAS